jgi:hypothetical protein
MLLRVLIGLDADELDAVVGRGCVGMPPTVPMAGRSR